MEELTLDDLRAMVAGDMATHARVVANGEHHWDRLFQPQPASGGPFNGRNNALVTLLGFLRAKRFSIDQANIFSIWWSDTYCEPPLEPELIRETTGRFWVQWAQGAIPDDLPGGETIAPWEVWDWTRMEVEEAKLGAQSWLIPNVLSTGGLHYLSSPPGSGKTWVMCDLIRAAVFGDKWLSEFDIPQTKVLYIDEEMGVQKVLQRLRKLGMRSAEGMGYLNRVGVRLDNILDVERIVKHCQSQGIGLVLIDSLVRVHGLDENDNSQMRKLYDSFKKLLDVGITVLIAHHNRKGGTDGTVKHEGMRGAAEIVAAADMAFSVEKQANGLYRMFVTKGRLISDEDAIDVTFEIRDEDGLTKVRTLDAGARSEVITQEIRSKLIELISDSPGITQTRLVELCGSRKSVVAATLADLEASRIVSFEKGPKNSKQYSPTGLL